MKTPTLEKPSLETALRNALATRAGLVAELDNLSVLTGTTADNLAKLETTVDLGDSKGLADITRLQTVSELLPRRIAAKDKALTEAEEALLSACHNFVMEELGPFSRRVEARLRERVQKDLQPHFNDSTALAKAIDESTPMRVVFQLQVSINIANPGSVHLVAYAERLLDASARLRELDTPKPAALAA